VAVPRTRQSGLNHPIDVSTHTWDSRSNPTCTSASRALLSPPFSASGSSSPGSIDTRRMPLRPPRRPMAAVMPSTVATPARSAASPAATPAGRPDWSAYSTTAAAGVSTGARSSTSSGRQLDRMRTRLVEVPWAAGVAPSSEARRVTMTRARSRSSTGNPW